MCDYWSSLVSAVKEGGKCWTDLATVQPTLWQPVFIAAVIVWLCLARLLMLTSLIRQYFQPRMKLMAEQGVQTVLLIQRYRTPVLDTFLSAMAMTVSIEFYISFLPVLFWMNQWKLALQLCILMASGIYVCNSTKDIVCAPRPPCPPVWRLTVSTAEKENVVEYGFPSSHTSNGVALYLYLFQFCVSMNVFSNHPWGLWALAAFFIFLATSVVVGRLYLGMHTLIDVLGGAAIGICLSLLVALVDDSIVEFVIRGENVVGFQFFVSVLILFAYPLPEAQTPSFTDVVCFDGAVLGVVAGLHYSFGRYFDEISPSLSFVSLEDLLCLSKRVLLGLPLALITKQVVKEGAIYMLPLLANLAGIPIKSTAYVKLPGLSKDLKALNSSQVSENPVILPNKADGNLVKLVQSESETDGFSNSSEISDNNNLSSAGLIFRASRKELAEKHSEIGLEDYQTTKVVEEGKSGGDNLLRIRRVSFGFSEDGPYDVDTGIRLVSYASLGWSVVVLAPAAFYWLGL